MTRYLRILLLATAALALDAGSATAAPYQDARQPVSKRVSDLLSRMTLQEKIGQMTQTERMRVDKDASPITTRNLGSILSIQHSCRRSTGSSPRGFRVARGRAWPTRCSAAAPTPASCR